MFKLLVPCENVDFTFLFACEIPTIDAKSCEEAMFTLFNVLYFVSTCENMDFTSFHESCFVSTCDPIIYKSDLINMFCDHSSSLISCENVQFTFILASHV